MFASLILNRRIRVIILFVLDNLFVESDYYVRSSTLCLLAMWTMAQFAINTTVLFLFIYLWCLRTKRH